jgi:Sec-independent protein translocase protein TatA
MVAELLQPTHLIIIAALLLLLFGGRWFATLGTGFRDAIRNFRNAVGAQNRK